MENGTVDVDLVTSTFWRQMNQRYDRVVYEKIELERRVEELQCENGSLRRRVAELESECHR